MELNKEFLRQRSVSVDGIQSSAEHTLPDYQGDVRKILYSALEVQDGGRYHNSDSLDCIGSVSYKIVYIDSEGRITPVSFGGDYEFSVKCPAESYVDADVHTRVTNFNLRLMGPRRFSVKCMLTADVMISERAEYCVEGDTDIPLETRMASVNVAGAACYRSGEREMADELTLIEDAIVDEVEVIVHSAEPIGVSAQRSEGGISVKGQIFLRALVASSGEAPCTYEGVLDFSELLESDGLSETASLLPRIDVLSETVSLVPVESGVSVVANVIAEAHVRCEENTSVSVLKDCFSTEREIGSAEGEFLYTEYVGSRLIQEKHSATFQREEIGAENLRNVLYENARIKLDDAEAVDGILKVSGVLHVGAIACEVAEDGAPSYSPLRFESPFTVNVNYNSQIPENVRTDVRLSVDSAHIDLDEDTLHFTANLSGASSIYVERREPCVQSISVGDNTYVSDPATVSVYYPSCRESLFEVAKKFHTSAASIARDNELSESVASGISDSLSASGIAYLLLRSH